MSEVVSNLHIHSYGEPLPLASFAELLFVIKSLKFGKASSPDGFPNCALKFFLPGAVGVLLKTINSIPYLYYFPFVWKHAWVIAIPKPGKDLLFPQIYSLISLLPSLSKLTDVTILYRIILFEMEC